MSKIAFFLALLATTAIAATSKPAEKPEVLPLAPAELADKDSKEEKTSSGDTKKEEASTKEKESSSQPEKKDDDEKTSSTGTTKEESSSQSKENGKTDETNPPVIESIAADGTAKTADDKATPSEHNEDPFEAKALEPEEAASAKKAEETTIPSSFTEAQQADIKRIILDAIDKNPEVIVKAIQKYSEQQQKEALQQAAEKMAKFKDDLTKDDTAIIGGNPNGSIKLVVFADPNCPHCRHFEANLSEVKGLFSNLKIYLRPWPIMGQESIDVVMGLMAAAKQGYDKYDSLAMRIASSNEKMDKVKFMKLSKELGLNITKLKQSMESDDIRKEVKSNHELALKIGLDATPTIIMFDADGTHILMPGDKESLKKSLTDAKA